MIDCVLDLYMNCLGVKLGFDVKFVFWCDFITKKLNYFGRGLWLGRMFFKWEFKVIGDNEM